MGWWTCANGHYQYGFAEPLAFLNCLCACHVWRTCSYSVQPSPPFHWRPHHAPGRTRRLPPPRLPQPPDYYRTPTYSSPDAPLLRRRGQGGNGHGRAFLPFLTWVPFCVVISRTGEPTLPLPVPFLCLPALQFLFPTTYYPPPTLVCHSVGGNGRQGIGPACDATPPTIVAVSIMPHHHLRTMTQPVAFMLWFIVGG